MSSATPRRDPKTGTWWFVVDLPPTGDGRRRQAKRRGFATRKAAQEALDNVRVESRKGTYVAPSRQTFREYIDHDWLPAIRPTVDRDTWTSYERYLRLHVTPAIGHVPVQLIDGTMLDRLYANLLADGSRKDGKPGGLKPRTVRYVHTIIHRALKDAVRKKRLTANAADHADPPSAKSARAPEMKVWRKDQLARFLELMENDRYRTLFLYLALTGCRRGEALGLRWQDVDFDRSIVSIRQQLVESGFKPWTKGDKPRTIDLDKPTVAALRAWKAAQAKERLMFSAAYLDHDLVFCLADGSPYNVERVSREFARRLARRPFVGELPRIRLHDLRHTWATLALLAGVDVKIVSERLGHASPKITWDIYQHVIQGMQSDAAEKVAALIFGAKSS